MELAPDKPKRSVPVAARWTAVGVMALAAGRRRGRGGTEQDGRGQNPCRSPAYCLPRAHRQAPGVRGRACGWRRRWRPVRRARDECLVDRCARRAGRRSRAGEGHDVMRWGGRRAGRGRGIRRLGGGGPGSGALALPPGPGHREFLPHAGEAAPCGSANKKNIL